ncbi:hypothetical protein C8F04DRAFT_1252099 [Mycena alexandri]|uniref:N-acetyltransferase domain-containing protein n=1 Tax=Mycena alexandri TaxID=1745969 RepID=A0AAD6TAV4_9AGAR|nr:hypothetical protein C8F04DRAFT_1252099 [Mycena alexandri]
MTFAVISLRTAENLDAQIDQLVDLCLRAYDQADTSIRALVGGDVSLLGDFFRATLRAGALGGASIYIATEATDTLIRGMALWWGPGVEAFSTAEQQRELQAFVSKLSDAAQQWHRTVYRPDFANLTEILLGSRGKLDSWYLNLLAVDPEHQRLGVARALIDAANHSELTLAATSELNVSIYRRLGFRVRGSMRMAGQVGDWSQQWREDSRDRRGQAALEATHSGGLKAQGLSDDSDAMLSLGSHAMETEQQEFPVYVLSWSETDGVAA